MFLGSISFGEEIALAAGRLNEAASSGGLSYWPVTARNFTGGYFLNSRLPWSEADFYYSDEAREIVVLMSGAVYNKEELCRMLSLTETVSDPELIAGLFLREGPEFVKHLNGDFAIMILRQEKKEAYLFRDHLGIRPLAYHVADQILSLSTDISGLCRAVSGNSNIDTDFLSGFFRYIDYRKTPYAEVKKLQPGEFLRFSEDVTVTEKYWHPERIKTDNSLAHGQMLSELTSLLSDAVRIRSDKRFRAGAHVSSGLDSGIVSVMARGEYQKQVTFYGFSWSPEDYTPGDVKYDERDIVRKLCQDSDMTPVFSDLNRNSFLGCVSSFYDNQGFFSEEKTVAQAVRTGTNLIFSGWGGDEFVSTAAPAIEADLLRGLNLGLYLRRNQAGRPRKFIKNLVHYVLMPALHIHERGTAKSFRDEARYLKSRYRKSDKKAVRQFYFHSSRRGHHLGMLRFYHLQDRCEKLFVMGYRNGVEYRYPLIDKRIVEFMLKVPSELLCRTDYFRPLLREISGGILPDEVRWNQSKTDPVYREYMDGLWADAASRFMEQVDEWRENPDLHFINFESLSRDIRVYNESVPAVRNSVIFRALIYIKAVHEFSRTYHKDQGS